MKKTLLIICDGLGYRKEKEHNAIAFANTPNLDYLWQKYPCALLKASGESVGLPEGQMGTSEANHLVIGSGRIIYQNLLKINNAIRDKELLKNPAIIDAFKHSIENKSVLHIKGLASPGGAHSHIAHIQELVIVAKQYGIKDLYLHLITDGRDTPPKSALKYFFEFEKFLKGVGIGKIATVGGRYWGMDRDSNHNRIEKHFNAIVKADAPMFNNALDIINDAYSKNITDEFIEPSLVKGYSNIGVKEKDSIIFANFRSDRAKQLAQRFLKENIHGLSYTAMTKYDDESSVPVIFPPEIINNTMSEIVSLNKIPQLKVTETEKFAHLTFYFNAQKYEANQLEERIMIPTNKDIPTHDLKPEMKVFEIADSIIKAIHSEKYGLICANLTNCDIVGHSANFQAIIKAVEAVDKAVGILVEEAKKKNIDIIITADHGNAEEVFDFKSGQPHTSHTINPVPFILVSDKYPLILRNNGCLSDIAPTILKIMELPIPREMTGESFV